MRGVCAWCMMETDFPFLFMNLSNEIPVAAPKKRETFVPRTEAPRAVAPRRLSRPTAEDTKAEVAYIEKKLRVPSQSQQQIRAALVDEMKTAEEGYAKLHKGDLKALADAEAKPAGFFSRFTSGFTKLAYKLSGKGDSYRSPEDFLKDYREAQRRLAELDAEEAETEPRVSSDQPIGALFTRRGPTQSGGMGSGAYTEVMERRGALQLLGLPTRDAPVISVEEAMQPFQAGLKKIYSRLYSLEPALNVELTKAQPKLARIKKDLEAVGAGLSRLYGQLDDAVRIGLEQTPHGKKALEQFDSLFALEKSLIEKIEHYRQPEPLKAPLVQKKRDKQPEQIEEYAEIPRPIEPRIVSASPTVEIKPVSPDDLSWDSLPTKATEEPREEKPIETFHEETAAETSQPIEPISPPESTVEDIRQLPGDDLSWASQPVGLYEEPRKGKRTETALRPKILLPIPTKEEVLAQKEPSEEERVMDEVMRTLAHHPQTKRRNLLTKPETREQAKMYARTVLQYQALLKKIPRDRRMGTVDISVPRDTIHELFSAHRAIKAANINLGLNPLENLDTSVEQFMTPDQSTAQAVG